MRTYKTKRELADAAKKWGSYGTLRSEERVSNNWNAEITGIYYNESRDKIYVEIYVQGSSTDTETSVSYEDFIRGGELRGTTENYGFRYQFSESEREEFLKKLSDQIDALNAIPEDVLERNKKIARVKGHVFTNPAVDRLYKKLNLWYSNYMYEPDPKYDAYCAAKKALCKYIDEHIDEIIVMADDDIHTLYWDVIWDAYNKAR